MMGQTGPMDPITKQFKNIVYMPCNPSNNFFPDLSKVGDRTIRPRTLTLTLARGRH